MADREAVKALIQTTFAHVQYPGDWCLRGGNEGDEPYLVEEEFKGRDDWRTLDPKFIDSAPDGYSSALSFFSDEAFHFYLPAYLIADLDGQLDTVDPAFGLCHGLDDASRTERVNPQRYGERTWFDHACHKFSMFNGSEARAIVAYLELKRDEDDFARDSINQALVNYWRGRSGDDAG